MPPSRCGTFLILALGTVAVGTLGAGPPQDQVDQAIDKGLDYLIRSQLPDGSFHVHTGFPVGSTALGLYTLLKCGLEADHQAVRRAEAYVLSRVEPKTYSHGCLLLALVALDPERHRARIHALAGELLGWQRSEGLWGYPEGAADFSNTQYALLGLWAATEAGFKVPVRNLVRAADTIAKNQGDYGGMTYRPFDPGGTISGSMSAAGSGSLALIRLLFERQGVRGGTPAQHARLQGALARGLKWFEDHFDPERDPRVGEEGGGEGTWFYYYLYGIERLGAFAGIDRFGKRDWYRLGASALLKRQQGGGHWGGYPGNVRDTCFALLFLRRATAPVTANRPAQVSSGKGKKADFSIRVGSGREVTMWVAEWPLALKEEHGWDDRELRVAWLRWSDDQGELARIEGDAHAPLAGSAALFPFKHAYDRNGVFQLRAEAELVDEGGRRRRVVSNQVEVRVDWVLTPEHVAWKGDLGRNLFEAQVGATAQASSVRGANAAQLAIDGLAGTAWVTEPEDDKPWLEVLLERPVQATHLVLTPALWHPIQPDAYDLPKRVVVRVGRQRQVAELPGRVAKTVICFGGRIVVNRIYLIVEERHPGGRFKGSVGFAEVELQDRR